MGDSPEWLRNFQVPSGSILSLSSDSNSSPGDSPKRGSVTYSQDRYLWGSSKLPQSQKGDHGDVSGSETKSPSTKLAKDRTVARKKKIDKTKKIKGNKDERKIQSELTFEECMKSGVNLWTLSSDSESFPEHVPVSENNLIVSQESGEAKEVVMAANIGGTSSQIVSSRKSPRKGSKAGHHTPEKENGINNKITDEGKSEKQIESHVSVSRLPLLLPEKVVRSKAGEVHFGYSFVHPSSQEKLPESISHMMLLHSMPVGMSGSPDTGTGAVAVVCLYPQALVECEGESIDVSGDMGAVGRIIIPDTSLGDHDLYLDLKGTVYKTTIVPSRTFCVVSFGQSEAKIEAIMNDFIQLKPLSNVYEAETMVEGTMNGFSFDSEDEADKMPDAISHRTNENDGIKEPSASKQKRKAEKTSVVKQKKEKVVGGRPEQAKRATKKAVVSKKTSKSRK